MIVPDPVWGLLHIDEWLKPVIESAEVQRLREVRLLNSSPVGLPALSDVRRYTHTMGVVGLGCRLLDRLGDALSHAERSAFLVAAILHDVATPPFGHSFEYLLGALSGWSHEGMLGHLFAGDYRPEGRYAQVFHGRQLSLRSILAELGVEESLVIDYVQGRQRLGSLVAGTIDLDNVDNVFRMAVFLGLRPDIATATKIIDGIMLDADGPLWRTECLDSLASWASLRRTVYRVLAFDLSNLQSQAMLTEAMLVALNESIIGDEHWSWTDEGLLARLEADIATRPIIQRLLAGPLYRPIFVGWYDQPKESGSDMRLPGAISELRADLDRAVGSPTCPYVFYDRGTFGKELGLRLLFPSGDVVQHRIGSRSNSTIACVFGKSSPRRAPRSEEAAVLEVLQAHGLLRSKLLSVPRKEDVYGLPGQAQLSI